MKNIIIGIDPGTTLAYSVLDIGGNILEIGSSKELNINKLISILIKKGFSLAVGTDVSPAPSFVEKLSKKLGAKLIVPDSDLKVDEKRSLTKKHSDSTKNIHESDSLAAAIFAYKSLKPLIEKTLKFTKEKKDIQDSVLNFVVRKEVPIKTAINIFEDTDEKEHKEIINTIEKENIDKDQLFRLYDKISQLKKERYLLKKQNIRLKQEKYSAEKRLKKTEKKLSEKIEQKKYTETISQKKSMISNLLDIIKKKEKENKNLDKKLSDINKLILDMKESIVLKKLKNLGEKEYNKKDSILNIKENDILFVEDADSYSDKIIKKLKEKISIIICKKSSKNTKKELPFTIIDSKDLKIKETELFALASEKDIRRLSEKKDILSRVIGQYKEQRKR